MTKGWGDLLTALGCLGWLIPLGFFTFIFLEWSARHKGEENLATRMFGEDLIGRWRR